jgi:hypothetical protein
MKLMSLACKALVLSEYSKSIDAPVWGEIVEKKGRPGF